MTDYSSSRNLSEKLRQEKEKSYDLGVEVRELKNKISLIRAGVPVSAFDTKGIDVIHKAKLRKNCHTIAEQVRFMDVLNHLIADHVLEGRDVETIESEKSDYARMSQLLLKYMSGPNGYPSLRRALRSRYNHICQELDNTDVKKEDVRVETKEESADTVESIEEKITELQEKIKQQGQKLNAKLKRQSAIITDQSTIIQSHSDAIAKLQDDISDQNKRQKDTINELERRMKESIECLEKQVRDDVTNLDLVYKLKQSQCEHQEMITQIRTEMEENAASVEERMRRMRAELGEGAQRPRDCDPIVSLSSTLLSGVGLANCLITLECIF